MQKTLNTATIYFFFWKKIINDVFFNVFRSINGILNKTPFYTYNICNLNKEENSAKKGFFSRFISYFYLLVEENQKSTFFISTIFFFSKIAQITYFYAFILILRLYIYFSLKPHKWTFFQCFSEIYFFFKGKPSLLRKKKYDFTPKVTFLTIFYWFQCFD